MKTYGAMKAHVREILDAAACDDVKIYPGPALPDVPDRYVVLTTYSGAGLEGGEHALDNRSWQARCVGWTDNYESAEEIANAIDIAFISHFSSNIQGEWVTEISRAGGAPSPLLVDDADRTHMVCSYVFNVESALVN